VLDTAVATGLCASWGIASWDPSPLPDLIDTTVPRPKVLMVRAGLLVGTRTLDAADTLAEACGLGEGRMWGMSPFGGNTDAPVWDRIDPRVFLQNSGQLSRVQAAFVAAYHIPRVSSVAVSTDAPNHLSELVGAMGGKVEERTVQEYRALLRDRSHGQPA
jgi:aryl-alcohol dehydrogenase-like predicted oxidoreductase